MATFGTFVDNVMLSSAEMNSLSVPVSFTPKCYQSAQITIGAAPTFGRYTKINKIVHGIVQFSCGSNGTANNRIEIEFPVPASSASMGVVGVGWFQITTLYRVTCVAYSTTRMAFLTNASVSDTTYLGQTNGPTATLAGTDVGGSLLRLMFRYEAA